MNVKAKMKALGMTQVNMIHELQKRGIVVQPPMLSSTLNGVYTYPKALSVLDECNQIVEAKKEELKNEVNQRS